MVTRRNLWLGVEALPLFSVASYPFRESLPFESPASAFTIAGLAELHRQRFQEEMEVLHCDFVRYHWCMAGTHDNTLRAYYAPVMGETPQTGLLFSVKDGLFNQEDAFVRI